MPQTRQDVTGRLQPAGGHPAGGSWDVLASALDATLRSSEATNQRLEQLAAQQKQANDRDLRMGRLPKAPGTHGSRDLSALSDIVDSAKDEIKADVTAAARAMLGEMRQAVHQEVEQETRRTRRESNVPSPTPRAAPTPVPVPMPVPPPAGGGPPAPTPWNQSAKPEAAPPPQGPPGTGRGPEATSPVSDPSNEARGTDEMHPGVPDATSDRVDMRAARIGVATSEREKKEEEQALARRYSTPEQRASGKDLEANFKQKVGAKISDFGERRLERAPQLATNIHTEKMHHVLPDGSLGAEATSEEAKAFERATKTARIFRNYGGSIAQGQGAGGALKNALPGIMGKVGMVGAAYTAGKAVYGAVNSGMDKVADQARANMEFQAIQGGEGNALTNTDAMQERFSRARFAGRTALGRMTGGMNKEEATDLYNKTTALGLQGNARQQSLDLATESFKRFGMTVDDSMKLITAASKSGNESLMGIGEALEQVTDAAVRSGRNAKEARDGFIEAYQAAAPMFTEQGAAASVAGGVAAANSSLGREFQGVNLGAGLSDIDQMRMVAAQSGQQVNDIVLGEGGNTGTDYLRQREDFRNRRLMDQMDPTGVAVMGRYSQMAADRKKPLTGDEAKRGLREIGDAGGFLPDVQMAMELLKSTGVEGVTPNNALQMLFLSATGSVSESREAEQIADDAKNYTIDPDKLQFKSVADGMGGDVATNEATKEMGSLAEAIGGDTGDFGAGTSFMTSGDTKARRNYLDQLQKGRFKGQGSKVIERMLKAGDEDSKLVVKAMSKDGKPYERVVNIQDAVKYYGDQLRRGDVTYADGENEGKQIAEVFGGEVDERVNVTTDDEFAKGRNSKGEKRSTFEKNRDDKDDRGKGGTVTIEPSPALARLIQFSSVGNVEIGSTVPPDPHVPAALLPSGQTGVGR